MVGKIKFVNSIEVLNFITDINKIYSDVDLIVMNKRIDAKSFTDVLGLDLSKPYMIELLSDKTFDINKFKIILEKYGAVRTN